MKRESGPRRKKSSKAAKVAWSLLLGVVAFQLLTSEGGGAALSSSTASLFLRRALSESHPTTTDDTRQSRPKMYTFFNPAATGAENSTDQETLNVWKEEWTRAGFDAQVLTLEDAMSHPNFESYKQILHDSIALYRPVEYNAMCFYRWLAMAVVGGGFMSDYDTVPLRGMYDFGKGVLDGSRDALPNNGKFTVYDWHVPSLISGSAEEWDRMSAKLWDAAVAQSSGQEKIGAGDGSGKTSDMVALLAVLSRGMGKNKPDGEDDVAVPGLVRVVGRLGGLKKLDDMNDEKCKEFRGAPAAHFSHSNLRNDYDAPVSERPRLMRRLSDGWRQACGMNGVEDEGTRTSSDQNEDDESQPFRQQKESILPAHWEEGGEVQAEK